jgi:AcrR family transcriptional regulator
MGDAAEREHGRPRGGRRGRDAAATRAAILEAARGAFTRESYDQVGVREIATVAGIDAALVIRYFGSKEGLFAAAIGKKFDLSPLFEGDARGLGERVARAVLLKPKAAGELDPMLILLRSAAYEEPGRMLRGAVADGFVAPLAARLEGPDRELRAGLIAALLLGLLFGRSVVRLGVLADAEEERLIARVGPMVQRLIDGE